MEYIGYVLLAALFIALLFLFFWQMPFDDQVARRDEASRRQDKA